MPYFFGQGVRYSLLLASFFQISALYAQEDSLVLRRIYDEALVSEKAFTTLQALCAKAPARLSGSKNAELAVEFCFNWLKELKPDSVWLQPTWVPVWERGQGKVEYRLAKGVWQNLAFTELGGSYGTQGEWLQAELVLVESMEALKAMPEHALDGKIALLNQAMDPRLINTFAAYGACGAQRVLGADYASQKGAKAVLVRSLSLGHDHHPHTGIMHYKNPPYIPGLALPVQEAAFLADLLQQGASLEVRMQLSCTPKDSVLSYNVAAQWHGRDLPEEVVLVGGHLDSWDNSQGAHDDGAGVVHAIETLRLLKTLNLRPRRSVRCVLFMNEESGARGAQAYADSARAEAQRGVTHLAAIESDRGGFSPRGFSFEALGSTAWLGERRLKSWQPLLEPYGLQYLSAGGSGVDVSKLKPLGTLLLGLVPDPHRYFDVHHTPADNIDAVHPRELCLGAAAVASMAWLLAEHGLPAPPKPIKE